MVDEQPRIWVKVVEAHAVKTWMGIILAVSGGVSLMSVAVGAVVNTIMNPEVTDLSANFMTLLGTSMGTLFGGLIGYMTGQAVERKNGKNGDGSPLHEGEMTLHVEPPPESQPPPGV